MPKIEIRSDYVTSKEKTQSIPMEVSSGGGETVKYKDPRARV